MSIRELRWLPPSAGLFVDRYSVLGISTCPTLAKARNKHNKQQVAMVTYKHIDLPALQLRKVMKESNVQTYKYICEWVVFSVSVAFVIEQKKI